MLCKFDSVCSVNDDDNGVRYCQKHTGVEVTVYCEECAEFLCEKCLKLHNKFRADHKDSLSPAQFVGALLPPKVSMKEFMDNGSKCSVHPGTPLDTVCLDCNCLCCLKCRRDGVHKCHNTSPLEKAEQYLRRILERSVGAIRGNQGPIDGLEQRLTNKQEDMEEMVNETKELVHSAFDGLRAEIDKKEEEVVDALEKIAYGQEEDIYRISAGGDDLSDVNPSTLRLAETLLSHWKEVDYKKRALAALVAGRVFDINKKADHGKKVLEDLRKFEEYEIHIDTAPLLAEVERMRKDLSGVQEVLVKKIACSPPANFVVKEAGSILVSLSWSDKRPFGEFVVSYRKKGEEEDCEWCEQTVDGDCSWCVLYPLKPRTEYEFRVMGKDSKDGTCASTKWSAPISAKTAEKEERYSRLDDEVNKLKAGNNHTAIIDALDSVNLCAKRSKLAISLGEGGAIEVILEIVKRYLHDEKICKKGLCALRHIACNGGYQSKAIAFKMGAIGASLDLMRARYGNPGLCYDVCFLVATIAEGIPEFLPLIAQGADTVLSAVRRHNGDWGVCANGLCVLGEIAKVSKRLRIETAELALTALNNFHRGKLVCEYGSKALLNVARGNIDVQNKVRERKGVETLLGVLGEYKDDLRIMEPCFGAIAALLSSEVPSSSTLKKTYDTLKKVSKGHEDSPVIKQALLELLRGEDPEVKSAISRGVCTAAASEGGKAKCSECRKQQWMYTCYDCDKDTQIFYCEVCWKKHDQSHKHAKFFCSEKCGRK